MTNETPALQDHLCYGDIPIAPYPNVPPMDIVATAKVAERAAWLSGQREAFMRLKAARADHDRRHRVVEIDTPHGVVRTSIAELEAMRDATNATG